MTKLLIDADGIVYRAGFAMEKTQYLVEYRDDLKTYGLFDNAKDAKRVAGDSPAVIWSRKETKDEEEALMLTSIIVKDITERYSGMDRILWLTPSVGNFRDKIATRAKYKGNRDAAVRPTHHKAIREYLVEKYGAQTAVGEEADDALGIAMTANKGSVLVSFDKDMLQVPGLHYNWVTKEETKISPKTGELNFWAQVLSGDTTDNIPGIPGIGPAKARKALEGLTSRKEIWFCVVKAYEAAGLTRDAAIETARLVWVRRKEGEIWQPPSA